MPISRRQFLATTGSLAVLPRSAATQPRTAAAAAPDAGIAAIEALLANPPHEAKPMTRWWWFGGAVTKAEITRELTFMRDAGLRGAEIQPVYPVELDDPSRNVRNLRYYSPEWFDAVRHAVAEAQRLGLQLDFTLGSGWPYGGPFIPPPLAARRIRVLTQDVVGPAPFSWNVGALLTGDDRVIATVAVPLGPGAAPDLARAQVLDGQPGALMQGSTRIGTAVEGWTAPDGHWRVMMFLDSPTGMLVKRPTYGMEGFVLDHHNREAAELFLRAAGSRVLQGLGGAERAPFTSVFCDSLEVYGADWTARLPEEFRKRRGYDLVPHLPALFHEAGPLTPHVRHDYHLTLSDLILDEFFVPLVTWAEAQGMTARIQAHGAMGDVMRGYGLAHIPEGESIFLGDRYAVNLKHRRLASSAAHLYERPIVSAEAYTWLRTPMFMTTLEQMKALSDAMFLDGINALVNHGYAYSPPEAGEPGWAFYASTEVNHTNTWWRHYLHLAGYVQRVSALLRQGVSINPVGVYLPLADVYAGVGAGGLHIDVEVERQVDADLLNGIRRAGYDFDLLNDHALATAAAVDVGGLRIGTGRYRAVIVPPTRYMPPESARRLVEFARAGGHLIVVGAPPQEAPGVKDLEARSSQVRDAFSGLFGAAERPAPARPTRSSVVADTDAAVRQLRSGMAPDFELVPARDGAALGDAVEHVGFTHRRAGGVDVYFVANVSGRERSLRARFDVAHRAPRIWNPETGAADGEPPYAYGTRPGRPYTEIELRLDPFESRVVLFGSSAALPLVTATDSAARWSIAREPRKNGHAIAAVTTAAHEMRLANGRLKRAAAPVLPSPVRVEGSWRLAFGKSAPVALDRLRPWGEIQQGRGFSGWGVYEIEVDVPESPAGVDWLLDLGSVHETAEATLNGRALGAAWKGNRHLRCGGAVVRGRNTLRVEVANLWIHHLLAHGPDDPARQLRGVGPDPALAETAGIRWGTYGEVPPEQVPPSGLLGPVRLLPVRQLTVPL